MCYTPRSIGKYLLTLTASRRRPTAEESYQRIKQGINFAKKQPKACCKLHVCPADVFASKGLGKLRVKGHGERWLPIQEKLPLPFDTQIAQDGDFLSKGRKKF